MTVNDLVTAVLAFVRMNGAIGAVAWLTAALVASLAVLYLSAKVAARVSVRKSFDVGGSFDHFYSRILPAARPGVVYLIGAGYAGLWLSAWPAGRELRWLYQPFNSVIVGVLVTLIVVCLAGKGFWELAKAAWFAMRWLRLEARGLSWHFTDSGEPHRVLWVRQNGEYLYDTTIRDHRLNQELETLHARRHLLMTTAAVAAAAIVVWLVGPSLIKTFYPLLSFGVVSFLSRWAILPILTWIVFLFFVIPKTVEVIAALLDELVYRSGAQFIAGAKVLDPGASRLGRKDVEDQNAHGDADFVTAAEAVRRMAGQPEL
jgi:hypothetical protein